MYTDHAKIFKLVNNKCMNVTAAKVVGPDGIPNRLMRDLVYFLAGHIKAPQLYCGRICALRCLYTCNISKEVLHRTIMLLTHIKQDNET